MTDRSGLWKPQQATTHPEDSEWEPEGDWVEDQHQHEDPARYFRWELFRSFLAMVAVTVLGFGSALTCQALIPKYPEWRTVLIWASMVLLFGVGCVVPIAIAMRTSYRTCGSLRPALATILRVLVIGLIWSAVTNRDDDTREG